MTEQHSLLQGGAFFTAAAMRMEGATRSATVKAARVVRDEAKRVLGTYDYDWTSLTVATVERKSTGDSPGLETGQMRDSIKYSISGTRLDWEAVIGTDMPRALFFELGTVHQPPRSFLAGAMIHKEQEVQLICGHDLVHRVFSHSPDFEDEWSYDGED